jgi:excisionase family DNA binding protein
MVDKQGEGHGRGREPDPTSGYITVAEAARRTGLSYAGVLAAIHRGRVPGAKKVGSVWRVPVPPEVTGRRRRTSTQEVGEIARLAKAGVPKRKIAEQLGLREREVYRVLRRQREREES